MFTQNSGGLVLSCPSDPGYNPQNQTTVRPWDLFQDLQLSPRKVLTSNQKEQEVKFLSKIYIMLGYV